MNINDISDKNILAAMLAIMTPTEIYQYLPPDVQVDIDCEIEDELGVQLD